MDHVGSFEMTVASNADDLGFYSQFTIHDL